MLNPALWLVSFGCQCLQKRQLRHNLISVDDIVGGGGGKWHFPSCLCCYWNLGGAGQVGSPWTRCLLTTVLNGLIRDFMNSTFHVYPAYEC